MFAVVKTIGYCAILCSFSIGEAISKKTDLEDKIGLHNNYGTYGFPLLGLAVAIKIKTVLVLLAIWGGLVITAKLFLALLWPFLSGYMKKCPFKHHGYHHDYDRHGYDFETPEFDRKFFESPAYSKGSWDRNTKPKRDKVYHQKRK